ncbi:hypothetical protein B0H14DRAFT_3433322 [Mycena olivaceomarginata]|nr:hypothetical protein B0H14DRAFT_3433322 [Mycena olivaceomarginata]
MGGQKWGSETGNARSRTDKYERERILVPLGNGQVCEGEMEGLVRATGRALQDGQSNILCVADSQAALTGILTEGNELADVAAKEATHLEPGPSNFVSLASARRCIHDLILGAGTRAGGGPRLATPSAAWTARWEG